MENFQENTDYNLLMQIVLLLNHNSYGNLKLLKWSTIHCDWTTSLSLIQYDSELKLYAGLSLQYRQLNYILVHINAKE